MGFKRRIAAVLFMAALMVAAMAQGVSARPATITNVSIKGSITSDGAIQLTWKAHDGASFYLVYRAPVYNGIRIGRYKHVGTAYSNSYIDGNVGKDMTYRYFLRFGVGKKSYKSTKKDVHVGIDPPRFLMARDGGDEYSSTDYNRITLVAEPGSGTIPDGIVLEKKINGKYTQIDEKEYGKNVEKEDYQLEFVDKDVKAGAKYKYRIRAFKGSSTDGTLSGYTYITMRALNQVGRYTLSWRPNTLKQKNTIVLCIKAEEYNYGLVLNKRNRCEVALSGDEKGQKAEARVSHFSKDGKTWHKAPARYAIRGGVTYVAITGDKVGMNTVDSLVIPGTYSGKPAGISMKNQLKLYYLQNDVNVEFYGNNG